MLNAAFKGLGRPVVAAAVAATMLFAGASAASAASVSVAPSDTITGSSATLTVSGTGFAASTNYRIGECSKTPYGALGVPACGAFTTVTTDGSGNFSGSLGVTDSVTNVHAGLPAPIGTGQPTTFDCLNTGFDQCSVWVVNHTGSPSLIASKDIWFN
jgi:hypothetical protein